MDTIIKITIGLFVGILVVFGAVITYSSFIETQYRNSFAGTYTYTCTITTDTVLSNVTFFLPVPADIKGNSPIVSEISSRNITGVPNDWTLTLYDTGKATLLKVTAPTVGRPAINGSAQTTINMVAVTASSRTPIATLNPAADAAVFRPIQESREVECEGVNATVDGGPTCYRYLTSTYADYTASPMASVSISATLVAENTWNVFQPSSNGYKNTVYVLMQGENHGWVTTRGFLESGIGSYNVPGITS